MGRGDKNNIGASAKADRAGGLRPEPVPVSAKGAHPLRCPRCHKPRLNNFYQGRRQLRCGCYSDYRTPVEKRRDAVLDKYGDDPAAYTPKVLAKLAKGGLFDIANAFCPAGKLSMEETRKREAAAVRDA